MYGFGSPYVKLFQMTFIIETFKVILLPVAPVKLMRSLVCENIPSVQYCEVTQK
jgi:hypothetical protein